ncbi:unnamed protein product [Chrysoparadoxa australica]
MKLTGLSLMLVPLLSRGATGLIKHNLVASSCLSQWAREMTAGEGFGAQSQAKAEGRTASSTPPSKRAKQGPPKPAAPVDRSNLLIVGLGNPGSQYEMTRHNIGFLVAEELSKRWGSPLKHQSKFSGEYSSARVSGKSVGVLRPLTYMNASGEAARKAMSFFKVPPSNVLVLVDDIAIGLGQMRIRAKGSPGGHNGLKSMQSSLQTQEYPRLRLGVGAPQHSLVDHVLGEFTRTEQKELPFLIADAADAVEMWIAQDDIGVGLAQCRCMPRNLSLFQVYSHT